MKKGFALLLVLALVISMMPTTIFANEEVSAPSAEVVQEQATAPVQTEGEVQTDTSVSEQTKDTAAALPDAEPATEQTDDAVAAAAEEPLMELAGHPQHDVCGRMTCTDPTHTHEATAPEWLEIKNANISTLAAAFSDNTAHYFFLGEDVTVAKNIMIGSKTAKGFVHLCLNGHTLTVTDARLFSMYNGTASICDCMGTGRIESKSAKACNGAIGFWQQPTKGEPGATIDVYGGTLTYAADTANLATHGFFYVTNSGILNLYGGVMDGLEKGTTATNGGGGCVTVAKSGTTQFNMYGGTIQNFKVDKTSDGKAGLGGAVLVQGGTFFMEGGTIRNNSAALNGGGVYIYATAEDAYISGSAVIENNTLFSGADANLFLTSGRKLILGTLTADASVGITMAVPGVFSDTALTQDDLAYFTSDNAAYQIKRNAQNQPMISAPQHAHVCWCGGSFTGAGHTHVTEEHDWLEIKNANVSDLTKTFADNQEHYFFLGEDITVSANIQVGTQATPTTLHLCLNGHKLTVTASRLLNMYNGLVTICDCAGTGRIEAKPTGTSNGAIAFWQQPSKGAPEATIELYSGTLTYDANVSNLPTHGLIYVANSGILNIYGGTIDGANKGTTATDGGGGGITLFGSSTLNMYGGTIENCKVDKTSAGKAGLGGAVLVQKGTLNMQGGTIRNCSAAIHGGGVYVNAASTDVQISGSAKIEGNTLFSGSVDNLYLASGRKLVLGTLSSDASIGITMAAPGVFSDTAVEEADLAYFTSDNPDYSVKRNAEGKPRISLPEHEHICYCGGTCTGAGHTHVTEEHDWIEIKNSNIGDLVTSFADGQEYYLYLGEDVSASYNIIIGSKTTPATVHLCLNGYTLTSTAARVFSMYNGKVTVCDCVGTGRIEANAVSATNGAIGFWQNPTNGVPGAAMELYGGTMTYAADVVNLPTHGMFYLANSGVLKLYGGVIDGQNKGTTTTNGGAGCVTVSSVGFNEFYMYGGTIQNCRVEKTADNKAGLGGAVYVQKGRFAMYGGSIVNNFAGLNGGGVYVSDDAENPYISGSAVIKNNKAGEADNNLYLSSKRKVDFGTLEDSADVGIYMQGVGKLSEDVISQENLARISSDRPGTSFSLNDDGQPVLRMGEHSHDCYCGGSCTESTHTHVKAEYGWTEIRNSNITELCAAFTDGEDHYFYLAENVTVTKNVIIGNKTNGSGRVHLCLNGYTVTVTAPRMFDVRDGMATVCDCIGTGKIIAAQTETQSAAAIVFWQQSTLSNEGAVFEAYDVTFTYADGNPKVASHGLLYAANKGVIHLYHCTLDGKDLVTTESSTGAGGVTVQSGATVNTYGGTFKNLHAKVNGGAIQVASGSHATLKDTTFVANKAGVVGVATDGHGGAVANYGRLTLLGDNVFENNYVYGYGGAVYSNQPLTVTNGHFVNNEAAHCGGGLYMANGSKKLIVAGGVFSGNSATDTLAHKTGGGAGGGIYAYCNMYLTGGEITGNYSYATGGGGILVNNVNFVMTGGVVSGNYYMNPITGNGGAGILYYSGWRVTDKYHEAKLLGGSIDNNYSYYNGGGFFACHAKVTIDGTTFTGNVAEWNGAGYIAATQTYTVVKKSGFYDNECIKMGAGMLIQAGSFLDMCNTEFVGNYSKGSGCALCIYNVEGAKVRECQFYDNHTPANGAAIYCRSRYEKATFDRVDIHDNTAKISGAAIYGIGEIDVLNCNIYRNVAGNHGGVLYGTTGLTILFDGCHVYQNRCKNDGGALWTYGFTEIKNSVFENNTAGRDSGAIHNKVAFNFDSYVKLNEGTVIRNNTAKRNGGAICTVGAPTLTEINGAEIYGNRAYGDGGALYSGTETKLIITSASIHDNKCDGNGGGLYGQGNVKLLGGEITNNTCGGIGGGAYLSNELSDSGSLQHNNFIFGAVRITGNHAKTADNVYMTATAAGMMDNGVLREGADFTVQFEKSRNLTQIFQGAFDYQKLGANTYRITAASNALRPTEIDANGVKHFVGEVVAPKDFEETYGSAGRTAYETAADDSEEADEEQISINIQDKDDTSSQEQELQVTALDAGTLGVSAVAAALVLGSRLLTQ